MMEDYVPISQLQEGERYEQVFMIKSVKPVNNKAKPFVRFEAQDVTGIIEGVVWDMKLKPTGSAMSPGRFIRMKAFVRKYQKSLTLSVNRDEIQPFQGEPENITDYVPGPNDAVLDTYAHEVRAVFDEIEDPHIRDLMSNAQSRVDLVDILKNAPYRLEGPLAHRGGLLIFVADMIRVAKCLSESTRRIVDPDLLNRSIVLAGCVLRHIGWSTCTEFQGRVLRPKDAFYLTGIDRASFRFVNHLCLHAESDLNVELPEGKKQALENMCHSDPSLVRTIEGRIVQIATQTTASMHGGQFVLSQRNDGFGWSPDGQLFLGHLKSE